MAPAAAVAGAAAAKSVWPLRRPRPGLAVSAALAGLVPDDLRRAEEPADSEAGGGCCLARAFDGFLFTFDLAIVLQIQIIQRWKLSLKYERAAQRSQAGNRTAKKRWCCLRPVAQPGARFSISRTGWWHGLSHMTSAMESRPAGFPNITGSGRTTSLRPTQMCPRSPFRLRRECPRLPPPS